MELPDTTMTVYLKFFAHLREFLPSEPVPYPTDMPEGAIVGDVLRKFGVTEAMARLLLVNGRHVEWTTPLADRDDVSVFPPIGGG